MIARHVMRRSTGLIGDVTKAVMIHIFEHAGMDGFRTTCVMSKGGEVYVDWRQRCE